MTEIRSIQKCEHCETWTDGKKAFCCSCGEMLDLEYRKNRWELHKRLQDLPGFMDWYKLKGADKNILLLILEKMIQGGQLILTAVVAFITLILLLLPG
ncbi:MAG TPA: hypothetical protein DCF33_00205 [Saprospirales bacterium]|nr:hypothetical protein [Saprospirales bacterium]